MANFLGLTVLATLKDGSQLRGTVRSIVPQVSLTLQNVYSPLNGSTLPECTIYVAHIAALDTEESINPSPRDLTDSTQTESAFDDATTPVQTSPTEPRLVMRSTSQRSHQEHIPKQQPEYSRDQKPAKFEDPAILSMGKRPSITPRTTRAVTTNIGLGREHAKVGEIRKSPKSSSKAFANLRRDAQLLQEKRQSRPPSPAANLIDPASFSRFTGDFKPKNDNTTHGGNTKSSFANIGSMSKDLPKIKRTRKRRHHKAREDNLEVAEPGTITPAKDTKPSQGWRQTPLLEPTRSFQPFSTLKKPGKAQTNGWGTEDASDVQEMGDFDFEGNLLKFDKHTVFGQIKAEDMTCDEDRLVTHNRLPKPGTAGGKNLHPSENVLDLPSVPNGHPAAWNSEAGDSDEGVVSHKGSGSGRTSRIADPKSLLNRRSNSRKASSITSSLPNSRPQTSITSSSRSSFYLMNSNRKCEVVSALQALNLENIANSELGLSEDMMTENAARGIAEVALSALNSGTSRRLAVDDTGMPIVVIFAGNNKSGQRAVAAGRHLRNHGVHVIVCVLGLEREPELLEDLRKQLKVYRAFGGKIFKKIDMIEHLKTLDNNVELVIDGLLGLTMTIDELRTGDQATILELITWANRSKANVLAIDVPSGIDPTSGKIAIIEGSPLYLNAKYIVSMSAPKKGLLQAMIAGEGQTQAWQLFVADVGIPDAAWKKGGTRMRRGVEFDQDWVVGLRFQHA